jgi:hypothetical protein
VKSLQKANFQPEIVVFMRLLLNFCLTGLGWILPYWVAAQVSDSFSDGDFTLNPVWTPDIAANWTVDNQQLRSNATTTNYNFYITTPSVKATSAQWEFKLNLQFNTSGANYVDIYLISEQTNLQSSANNGYFVRVGGTSDEVSLYKITAGATAILINGTDGLTNNSNNTLKIKVIRNDSNVWTLQTDATGTGENYTLEGTVTDNSFNTSSVFGVRIQQSTASFVQKHFLDDVYVGDIIIDNTPPVLDNVEVIAANQLALTFSENLTQSTAQTLTNYTVNNGIGNPSTAILDAVNKKVVHLAFAQNFISGQQNTLTVQNIADLAGNVMISQNSNFTYILTFAPQYHELIITEIMADPRGNSQPLNPLPEAEYIEIYNRSDKALKLQNCTFTDGGGTPQSLPNITILPNEYILICDTDFITDFQPFGKVVGLGTFPALTNEGENLSLRNGNGDLLFTVTYSSSWYGSSVKADGGWSLEMKDVNNPCLEAENWTASIAVRGGTPAQMNSISENLADNTAPKLVRAEAIDAQTLRLTFDEKMDEIALKTGNYQLNQGINIQAVETNTANLRQVLLKVNPAFQIQTAYTIMITLVEDCNLNDITGNNVLTFGLPEADQAGDIILNEILFNPPTGGYDFVEIYNISDKYINLQNWKLANLEDGIVANQTTISNDIFVLAPKAYLVLTEDKGNVQSNYPQSKAEYFLEMSSLPSYPDDEGAVILINSAGELRERFDYQDDFHYELLDEEEGVSLERIAFDLPVNDKNTWQSAAERVGFATPGYLNSQTKADTDSDKPISINPKVFTPDGDGDGRDFTNIEYLFAQGGYVLTAQIFDKSGRLVKTVAENQLLGFEKGNIQWDGSTNAGGKAAIGYYLVLVKVFDLQGKQKIYKETVVVGARF